MKLQTDFLSLDQLTHFGMSRWGQWTGWGIAILFIFLILGKILSSIQFRESSPASMPLHSNSFFMQQSPSKLDLSSLHLFGLYKENLNEIPKSTLDIVLSGIFLGNSSQASQAVLTIPGQGQKIYYVGSELPDNIKLYRILDDSVIIQYNGELQRLMLDKTALKFSDPPTSLNLPLRNSQ